MKKIIIVVALFTHLVAQEKIAVMPFKYVGYISEHIDTEPFTERLSIEMFRQGNYQIIERNSIQQIIDEQRFQASDLTNERIVKIGNMLGVKYAVIGNVSTMDDKIFVSSKMIDVETAEVVRVSTFGAECRPKDLVDVVARYIAMELSGKLDEPTKQEIMKHLKKNNRNIMRSITDNLFTTVLIIALFLAGAGV